MTVSSVNSSLQTSSTTSSTATSSSTPGSAITSQAGLNATFNQFLTMLTTQLKNQDPLNPQDSSQFTSQLVQYSQVEQQLNTNTKLDTLINYDKTNQALQATNYIGDTIQATGNTVTLNSGSSSEIGVKSTTAGGTLTVSVSDSSGKQVKTLTIANAKAGLNTVSWDGTDQAGNTAAAGVYTVSVSGVDSSGKAIDSSTLSAVTIGKVTDVSIDPTKGVQLMIGSAAIPLANLLSIQSKAA